MYPLSRLLKSSCKQLHRWRRFEADKPPSLQQRKARTYGNAAARSKIQEAKKANVYEELTIKFRYKDICIMGCVDEIRVTPKSLVFIEHKNTEGEAPSWLWSQAVIQVAMLSAMYHYRENDVLKSASFVVDKQELTPAPDLVFKQYAWVNREKFKIEVAPEANKDIIRFFLTKVRASENFKTAERFDNKYKHKEWEEYFRGLISYKGVTQIR